MVQLQDTSWMLAESWSRITVKPLKFDVKIPVSQLVESYHIQMRRVQPDSSISNARKVETTAEEEVEEEGRFGPLRVFDGVSDFEFS